MIRVDCQVLAEKVHIRSLSIAQRVQLLQDGLNDRSGVCSHSSFAFSLTHYAVNSPRKFPATRRFQAKDFPCTNSEFVREACASKLLQSWLRTFQGSSVELLQCLDVETCPEIAEKTVSSLLKKVPAKELVQSMDMLDDE